jgi:hypothetical protein
MHVVAATAGGGDSCGSVGLWIIICASLAPCFFGFLCLASLCSTLMLLSLCHWHPILCSFRTVYMVALYMLLQQQVA